MEREISEEQANSCLQIIEDLQRSCKTMDGLEEKNNNEIADLLRDHLWSYLDAFSPLADLVEIAMDRLRASYNQSFQIDREATEQPHSN